MEQNWERGRQGVAVRTRVLLLWYWWCHQCTWAVNGHMLRTDLTLWNLQYVSPAWHPGPLQQKRCQTRILTYMLQRKPGTRRRSGVKDLSQNCRSRQEDWAAEKREGQRPIRVQWQHWGENRRLPFKHWREESVIQGHNRQQNLMSSLCWNLWVMLRLYKEQQ